MVVKAKKEKKKGWFLQIYSFGIFWKSINANINTFKVTWKLINVR